MRIRRMRAPIVNSSDRDPRIISYILIAIGVVALVALAWLAIDVFVIMFGAIVVGTVLQAATAPVSRLTGWSHRVSLGLVILVLLVVFGLLAWMFGAQAANQFAEFRERLPQAARQVREWLESTRAGRGLVESLKEGLGDKTATGVSFAAGALVGGVGNLLLILFAGIYFAADPDLYRRGMLRLFPPSRRGQVDRAAGEAGRALQRWLIAQLIIMLSVGVLTGVALALIGVPLAIPLGVLAGLLEFIPVIGPIIAAAPGLLLAFATSPKIGLYALITYLVVQQLESNVITPLTQRWAVQLPPVVALLSIVAGGLLFGVLGVVFATPMAVVVMVLVQKLYIEDTLEGRGSKSKLVRRADG